MGPRNRSAGLGPRGGRVSGAGNPPSLAARRKALAAEQERLLAEQADLLQELPGMHPLMGARAATVLDEKFAALERENQALHEEERHGHHK